MDRPSASELGRLLKEIPFFAAVPAADLEEIVPRLEWVELSSGEVLFQQGTTSEGFYVLVFGRLVAAVAEGAGQTVVGEITRGECVGEMGFMTDEPRSASVRAVRDSYLLRMDSAVFEAFVETHPQQMRNVTNVLIRRLKDTMGEERYTPRLNFHAFVPLTSSVPIEQFAARLRDHLPPDHDYEYLSKDRWQRLFCAGGDERFDVASFYQWVYEHEEEDRMVFFECAPEWGEWTRYAVQNADRIFLVGRAGGSPRVRPVEEQLQRAAHIEDHIRHELILLRDRSGNDAVHTADWLDPRDVDRHHHVQLSNDRDLARIARFIRGEAIGLVLGGGGARGFAHLGVIQAMEEAGVPTDYVGGTSMGAIMAAAWAKYSDATVFTEAVKEAFMGRGTMLDYTLPMYSLIRGKEYIDILEILFGEGYIEDLPINYFCVSTNLSKVRTVVNDRGKLFRWVLSSITIPGIGPPFLDEGELLVDGAVLNNIPVDVMDERLRGDIIAVDVSSSKELKGPDDTDIPPSPYKLALRKLSGRKTDRMPNIFEILWKTSILASLYQRPEKIKQSDLYIKPPLTEFNLFDWDHFDEIVEAGYRHARSVLDEDPLGRSTTSES
ncbi:MAG: cyclic nucleotide-binding and patatin-like phospholipase domain-containing protein [Salinibacter sp.]